MAFLRYDQTQACTRLQHLAQQKLVLKDLFQEDSQRFTHLSFNAPCLLADLSKQHITPAVLNNLLALAYECQVQEQRDAMLRGDAINLTEGRQVLHTALRANCGETPLKGPYHHEVSTALEGMLCYAEQIRNNPVITDIVNIGIGGSDLGPRMAVEALLPFTHPGKRYHFVSNVDGFDLASTLQNLKPESTLFIISSKSFSTQETLANAHSAKVWFETLGGKNLADHFVSVTTNTCAAQAWGIERIFSFWDWVGGRYSLWSSVGLVLAIAIGAKHFQDFLQGAYQMDTHFAHTPLESNVPVLLALVDIWNRNFLQRSSRCVSPYHQGLVHFPTYLQQLEMESNGKSVDIQGNAVTYATSATVWGDAGTNGQHAFFQMLHQGTDVIPVDFIIVSNPIYPQHNIPAEVNCELDKQHQILLANALAQSRALMVGQTFEQALSQLDRQGNAPSCISKEVIAHHRTFSGNRPSTVLLLQQLDPQSLGALIALHEHRTFVAGAIWGLGSFDQWGVELGKTLAKTLLSRLEDPLSVNTEALDASTTGLLQYIQGEIKRG